ncbi:hypothetical protein [Williamsia sp. 1135]|uniref:hypothetical protein n=1 Tax=Williamsia sp. 1135 TaxID=1889262 RepID=UPI00117D6F0A|nr:hypothetical protein [Williamsia sp. 1135]
MMQRILIALTALGLLAVGGCAGEEHMNSQLAHDRIVELIQTTADALPWSATLVTTYPGYPHSTLGDAPGPCTGDDSGDPDQPYNWTFGMWLLVPGDMDPAQVRAAVIDVWRADGHHVRGDYDVVGVTGDGFALTMVGKPDDVSLRVSSPCFPNSAMDRGIDWPERITTQRVD